MRIAVFGDAGFTNQALLVSQLNTLHAANKALVLVTAGRAPADGWARAWAQSNGVPWVALDDDLDTAGYAGPEARSLAAMRMGNVDTVLTAGSNAPSAPVANVVKSIASNRGHSVTSI